MGLIFRQNALNVKIEITVFDAESPSSIVDVSSASTKDFIVRKPDGTRVVWAASFVTNGTDGKLKYITNSANDFDQKGRYKIQVDLVIPGTYDGPTDIAAFYVEENL